MARKGQKLKSYPEELKAEVLRKYLEEYIPSSALEEEYGIPQKTIRNWASKLKQGKNVLVDHRQFSSGRPPKDETKIDYKERYEILKKYQAFLKAQREKK